VGNPPFNNMDSQKILLMVNWMHLKYYCPRHSLTLSGKWCDQTNISPQLSGHTHGMQAGSISNKKMESHKRQIQTFGWIIPVGAAVSYLTRGWCDGLPVVWACVPKLQFKHGLMSYIDTNFQCGGTN